MFPSLVFKCHFKSFFSRVDFLFQTELKDLVDKKCAKPIYNLDLALNLISDWESELSLNTTENTELVKYLQTEMSKLRKNMSYVMQFHERILNLVCHSKVFMYPELLPPFPFRFKTTKLSEYLPAEDLYVFIFFFVEIFLKLHNHLNDSIFSFFVLFFCSLIAFLLEHFFEELQQQLHSYKLKKTREVTLSLVCHHISAHLGYIRHWKSIYDYVRLRRKNYYNNPIKVCLMGGENANIMF